MTRVIAHHLVGKVKVCISFHNNTSKSCLDISCKTANVNLMVALEERSQSHQCHGFTLRRPYMFSQNFKAVHPIVIDIFKPGPKRLID